MFVFSFFPWGDYTLDGRETNIISFQCNVSVQGLTLNVLKNCFFKTNLEQVPKHPGDFSLVWSCSGVPVIADRFLFCLLWSTLSLSWGEVHYINVRLTQHATGPPTLQLTLGCIMPVLLTEPHLFEALYRGLLGHCRERDFQTCSFEPLLTKVTSLALNVFLKVWSGEM